MTDDDTPDDRVVTVEPEVARPIPVCWECIRRRAGHWEGTNDYCLLPCADCKRPTYTRIWSNEPWTPPTDAELVEMRLGVSGQAAKLIRSLKVLDES